MAQVKLGNGAWLPPPPRITAVFGAANLTAMTATGHKVAFVGRMWNAGGVSKTLVGVGILFGAVTKAGGSGIKISQQGVDGSTSVPFQPNGVEAQSWAISNASLPSSAWADTGDNAGVSVAFGENLSIVVEYDASGRLGSDSVVVRGLTGVDTGPWTTGGTATYNGSAWSAAAVPQNVVLKFSDGTYGALEGGIPNVSINQIAFNSGSAADEIGLEFTVPAACTADGMWAAMIPSGTSADFDAVLYSGTTALATVSCDANSVVSTSSGRFLMLPFAPQALASGTTYRLVLKPTTTNSVGLYYLDLSASAHRQALPGFGVDGAYVTRADAGSWAAVTATRVPLMGLRISHIETGGGGTSTDPGIANVRAGTDYTIDDEDLTGTLVAPSLANTKVGVSGDGGTGTYDGSDRWSDPGVENVESGVEYKANSATDNRTGTYDPVTGNYTDPGESNVISPTAYTFAGDAKVGTLEVGGMSLAQLQGELDTRGLTSSFASGSAGGVNVARWLGTAPPTPTVAGVPKVDVSLVDGEVAEVDPDPQDVHVLTVAPDAVTAIQLGVATSSALATVATYVDTEVATIRADVEALLLRLTALRAGYLDNLSGGAVALASQIPADFTDATFASDGVFAEDALQNAPSSGGGGLDAAGMRAALFIDGANKLSVDATGQVKLQDDSINAATFGDVTLGVPLAIEAIQDELDTRGLDSAFATAAVEKTGYKLASDGLDVIAVTAPTGVAATFPQMVVQTWRRFFRRTVRSATTIVTYADNGTTPVTTQTISETETTQTQGDAS